MAARLAAVPRRELIRRLASMGFDGPFSGGRHEFMVRGDRRLTLPNPHRSDIGAALLTRLLAEAGVTRHEWDQSA